MSGSVRAGKTGASLVTSRRACAVLVTVAFASQCLVGSLVLPTPAVAAPASIAWTEQADFEANASSTGEPTSRLRVDTQTTPGDVTLSGPVVGIGSGCYHVLGLQCDRTVVAAGAEMASGCDMLNTQTWTDIVVAAGGFDHSVGLRADGTVVRTDSDAVPMDISGWTDMVSVAAGWGFTVGLRSDGTVVTAGPAQGYAQDTSAWTGITAVAAGTSHTLGLTADGIVLATGLNDANQLDTGSWTDVVAVAGGSQHSVALKSDGTVVAVGDNSHGQCDVDDWADITAIAAGGYHTIGLKSDGTVVAAGDAGQSWTKVGAWGDIKAISTGYAHTVGLRSDNTLVVTGADWVIRNVPDALMCLAPEGSIGMAPGAVGLRADLGAGSTPVSLAADFDALGVGGAVKFGVRLSEDGTTWSEIVGSDGNPIDWTSGTGTYLGQAHGDASARTDLSALPSARYLELVLQMEGASGISPVLHSLTLSYETGEAETYTVTFESNGGTAVPPQSVPSGGLVAEPAPDPTKDHYTFAGWYQDLALTVPWDFATQTVSSDMTLCAAWNIDTFPVTFLDFDDSVLSEQMVPWGEDAVAPLDPTREGHTFLGWDTDFTNVAGPLTVRALYDPIPPATQFTVGFQSNGGTPVDSQIVPAGGLVTEPAPPTREGYAFSGWFADAGLTDPWDFDDDVVTGDMMLYAAWTHLPVTYVRHDGIDRYETAMLAAVRDFPEGADVAIVATGERFPDALAASGLAGVVDAPILLTRTNTLSPACDYALRALGVKKVYILGDSKAVSSGIEAEFRRRYEVVRLGGPDRYYTARDIADEAVRLGASRTEAFLALGSNFPDALAMSSIATQEHITVLLTRAGELHWEAAAAISGAGVEHVYVAGDTRAVSATAANQVAALGTSVTRWGGRDRYATAAAVINGATATWGIEVARIGLATGANWPDALTGGAAMGRQGGLLLLTTPGVLSPYTEPIIMANKATITKVEFYGSTKSLSQAVEDRVRYLLQ